MRPRSTRRGRLLGAAAFAALVVTGIAAAAIVPVTNDGAGATALAAGMDTPSANVTGASFVTVPAAGTPHAVADAPLSSFPTNGSSFAIMTSGDANLADDPDVAGNSGANIGGPNVRGVSDFDVSILKIDLEIAEPANCLTLDFQFYSEEFPEWVNTAFNDAFIAELDSSTWTAGGAPLFPITAPNNFAFDPSGNVISINSSGVTAMNAANAAGTTYDGATPLLSASTPITAGSHSLYLSIFDQGDHVYDSAVFLDNLVVGFVPNPAVNCRPGAQPKTFSLSLDPAAADNDQGTQHTVTATLLEEGSPLNGAPITFEVSGANTTAGSGTTSGGGEATFTYTGVNAGSDVITACYDADGDGDCEAVASATKNWIHVNRPPGAACSPTTNPSGGNVPGSNASPSAGQNPDGFYVLLGADDDGPAPQLYVGDTGSGFVAGPYPAGTKVKITQANGTTPRAKSGAGAIAAHILLNGDALVWSVDSEGAASTAVQCLVPRPPK